MRVKIMLDVIQYPSLSCCYRHQPSLDFEFARILSNIIEYLSSTNLSSATECISLQVVSKCDSHRPSWTSQGNLIDSDYFDRYNWRCNGVRHRWPSRNFTGSPRIWALFPPILTSL